MLSVPGNIYVQIPSSLCMHLLSARNNHSNNEWALGAGCFVFRSWMFFFCFKTLWSQINMSILYSGYESPSYYSSLHLDKIRVFGPCGIFKTDMKKHDFFIYLLVAWYAILRTRMKMLFRGLESFNWVNVTVQKIWYPQYRQWIHQHMYGKGGEILIFMFDACHADLMTNKR